MLESVNLWNHDQQCAWLYRKRCLFYVFSFDRLYCRLMDRSSVFPQIISNCLPPRHRKKLNASLLLFLCRCGSICPHYLNKDNSSRVCSRIEKNGEPFYHCATVQLLLFYLVWRLLKNWCRHSHNCNKEVRDAASAIKIKIQQNKSKSPKCEKLTSDHTFSSIIST